MTRADENFLTYTCRKCKKEQPITLFSARGDEHPRRNVCKSCVAAYSRKRLASNPLLREAGRLSNRASRLKLREEVLDAYGHKCKCCGETTSEFLAIDHINNDGAAQRRSLHRAGKNQNSGNDILYFLRRNNFPTDNFQLLCHNCNLAKGFYGTCPHEVQRQESSVLNSKQLLLF